MHPVYPDSSSINTVVLLFPYYSINLSPSCPRGIPIGKMDCNESMKPHSHQVATDDDLEREKQT